MTARQFAEAMLPTPLDEAQADAWARLAEARRSLVAASTTSAALRARQRIADARALCEEFGVAVGGVR